MFNAFRSTLTCGLLGLSTLVQAQPSQASRRDVAGIYASLCANCHGAKMEGALGPSLIDDIWKSGADDEGIARSIREGQPASGMPAFSSALSSQDIRALVIYIREEGAQRRNAAASIAKPVADKAVRSELHAFKLETVTEGLDTPWSVAFLPDGRMLVTEKAGRLRVVEKGRLLPEPIAGTPGVWSRGQGGLLDVAVHPDYAKNGWIYLSYSDPGPNGSAMTAIVRGKLREGRFVEQQTLFRAPPEQYRTGNVHFGSRFVFDGKGHLFFSIGERGRKEDAQDLSRPNGKVHRIHDDGRIPQDNPFAGREGAIASIWSYGNRNPQGLARHPVTGELWETEHGPRGGDELNRIEPGRNYGWPVITYGMNYDGTPMTDRTAQEGMQQPVLHWTPSIAVCSADFYTGSRFPQWKNDLFVGALAQQEVRRLRLEGGKVVHQEVLFKDVGRVRDVVSGPDGYLYVAFNGPDRIARLVPAPVVEPASGKAPGAKP
ncbi:glucose sorbosone dehydrogenase [Archangium sp. Cb G35]|uniref:PQQ-dependent sugar dehydrogenase n=1 Tax=Archangium sp. Cb G35 TaxID=1920190 RepID=UPI000937D860|nr:PQQ-dependent sugar dehydrogenase [Archangium sp. Cb G35]OJT26548.1 glucose sorbosone dehydrogenase [Archangium sp. Cb G35]